MPQGQSSDGTPSRSQQQQTFVIGKIHHSIIIPNSQSSNLSQFITYIITLQGSATCPFPKTVLNLKMIFRFPKWDMLVSWMGSQLPARKLTYPTLGKGKSSLSGDMLVPSRVDN